MLTPLRHPLRITIDPDHPQAIILKLHPRLRSRPLRLHPSLQQKELRLWLHLSRRTFQISKVISLPSHRLINVLPPALHRRRLPLPLTRWKLQVHQGSMTQVILHRLNLLAPSSRRSSSLRLRKSHVVDRLVSNVVLQRSAVCPPTTRRTASDANASTLNVCLFSTSEAENQKASFKVEISLCLPKLPMQPMHLLYSKLTARVHANPPLPPTLPLPLPTR